MALRQRDFPSYRNPPTTDGVLDIKNAPYLFTCYPSPNPSPGAPFQTFAGGGGGSTDRAVIRRRFTKSVTQLVKNIGVFDSPRVRFRILGSSSGTQQRKGGKDLREEREKIWGKNALGERGEKIFGRKREIFLGGNRP